MRDGVHAQIQLKACAMFLLWKESLTTNKPLMMMVVYEGEEASDSNEPGLLFTDKVSGRGPTLHFHEGEIKKKGREKHQEFSSLASAHPL